MNKHVCFKPRVHRHYSSITRTVCIHVYMLSLQLSVSALCALMPFAEHQAGTVCHFNTARALITVCGGGTAVDSKCFYVALSTWDECGPAIKLAACGIMHMQPQHLGLQNLWSNFAGIHALARVTCVGFMNRLLLARLRSSNMFAVAFQSQQTTARWTQQTVHCRYK
jgi:hypothetical protein